MARVKYFAIRWPNGKIEIDHDIWDNVQKKVSGVSNVTFKSFEFYDDAACWLNKPTIPYRKVGDPYEEDKMYLVVDGSYSPGLKVAGWGWVAVLNNNNIGHDYGVVTDETLLTSRNIAGEVQAAMEAADWYMKHVYPKYLKPVIVHDYAGIGNWALGYWATNKDVSNAYREHMFEYSEYFDFEKINGHTGDVWNDFADTLAGMGCTCEKVTD